jgi:hypothetical protein
MVPPKLRFPIIPVTSGKNDCSKQRHQLPPEVPKSPEQYLVNDRSRRRRYSITNVFATSG